MGIETSYISFWTSNFRRSSIAVNVLGFVAVGEIEFVQPVQKRIKDTEFKLE